MSKMKVAPGTVFSIELKPDTFVAGLVMHVSKYFKSSVIVGLFDQLFNSREEIVGAELTCTFAIPPNYTGRQLLKDDIWPIVDHREDLLEECEVPPLIDVDDLFVGDEIIRRATSEDYERYEILLGQGRYSIIGKLERHFFPQEQEG